MFSLITNILISSIDKYIEIMKLVFNSIKFWQKSFFNFVKSCFGYQVSDFAAGNGAESYATDTDPMSYLSLSVGLVDLSNDQLILNSKCIPSFYMAMSKCYKNIHQTEKNHAFIKKNDRLSFNLGCFIHDGQDIVSCLRASKIKGDSLLKQYFIESLLEYYNNKKSLPSLCMIAYQLHHGNHFTAGVFKLAVNKKNFNTIINFMNELNCIYSDDKELYVSIVEYMLHGRFSNVVDSVFVGHADSLNSDNYFHEFKEFANRELRLLFGVDNNEKKIVRLFSKDQVGLTCGEWSLLNSFIELCGIDRQNMFIPNDISDILRKISMGKISYENGAKYLQENFLLKNKDNILPNFNNGIEDNLIAKNDNKVFDNAIDLLIQHFRLNRKLLVKYNLELYLDSFLRFPLFSKLSCLTNIKNNEMSLSDIKLSSPCIFMRHNKLYFYGERNINHNKICSLFLIDRDNEEEKKEREEKEREEDKQALNSAQIVKFDNVSYFIVKKIYEKNREDISANDFRNIIELMGNKNIIIEHDFSKNLYTFNRLLRGIVDNIEQIDSDENKDSFNALKQNIMLFSKYIKTIHKDYINEDLLLKIKYKVMRLNVVGKPIFSLNKYCSQSTRKNILENSVDVKYIKN